MRMHRLHSSSIFTSAISFCGKFSAKMTKLQVIFLIFGLASSAIANFNGPFLMWGIDGLRDFKVPALESLNDKLLRDLYSDTTAVVIFLRNASTRLSDENFPAFKKITDQTEWIYLPQKWLTSDPLDFNVNAEIINLVGDPSQQDIELSALYRDAIGNYGEGKVLGILATKYDPHDHFIHKRQASTEVSPTESAQTTENPSDEPVQDDTYVYNAPGKILLYTTSPFVIKFPDEKNGTELKSHFSVTSDDRDSMKRLIIPFKTDDGKIILRFRFPTTGSGWSLTSVEVEKDANKFELNVVGKPPSAPFGFSYKCSRTLEFRANKTSLTLTDIQVQPQLGGQTKFSDAYDCIGFTTAPIWAGVFVTSLFLIILSIGITAIMDIKTPNRFESRGGKQLTFTIQE